MSLCSVHFHPIVTEIPGFDRWNFVTERYFGCENTLVKETRIVKLRKPLEGVIRSTE